MHKMVLLILVLMLAVTALFGCAAASAEPAEVLPDITAAPEPDAAPAVPAAGLETADAAESEAALAIDPQAGILMSTMPKTVTTEMEQVTVLVANQTDKDYSMDYVQKLEKLENGQWTEVPLTTDAASLALLVIPAGEIMDFTFDFAYHYEKLEHGSYRICKTFVDAEGNALEAYCPFDLF